MSWDCPDQPGECNAHLYMWAHGCDKLTVRCGLKPGHVGLHVEQYECNDEEEHGHAAGKVRITWERDERPRRWRKKK